MKEWKRKQEEKEKEGSTGDAIIEKMCVCVRNQHRKPYTYTHTHTHTFGGERVVGVKAPARIASQERVRELCVAPKPQP